MTNPAIMWDRSLRRNLWMRQMMSQEMVPGMRTPQTASGLIFQETEQTIHHMMKAVQAEMVIIRKITEIIPVIIPEMILKDINSILPELPKKSEKSIKKQN